NETIQTNVRLIAATNRDLQRAVALGQFRPDLFYRLSVFTIQLPPLRERGSDLPLLVDHFRKRFNRELGKEVHQIHPGTLAVLGRHLWPGNLRELQSVIKQALLHTTGPVLLPEFLPPYVRDADSKPGEPGTSPCPGWDQFLEDRLRGACNDLYAEWQTLTERHLIMRVLRFTDGNQVQASKILGMARNSLRSKIRALGITIDRSVSTGEAEDE